MLFRNLTLFKFCNQITRNTHNSINPITQHVAYGHYFPKEWDQNEIYSQIDPTRKKVSYVQLIRNKIGQPSGKVLLKFSSAQALKACVERYNQDFIITKESAHRVIIKPFQLRTNELVKSFKQKKTNHQVKIKNLDFDTTEEEIHRLAKDFGNVAHIQMQIRPNQLNNGLATVYFQKRAEAEDFAYFCQGLLYKERKLSAEVIEERKRDQSKCNLQIPKITLESHEYIYKKMIAKHFQTASQNQKLTVESKPKSS